MSISALIYTHRKSVVLLAGLLLIAGQLLMLVHAADHPFHAEDEVCAAFASFEHHNHAIAAVPSAGPRPHLTCATVTGLLPFFADNPSSSYQSRAPPLHT